MAVTDVILSPLRVLYSPYGTTLPATTVLVGGAWPAGWTQLGIATKDPLKMSYIYDEVELDVNEILAPIDRKKTSEKAEFTTSLVEITGDYVALGMGEADSIVSDTPASIYLPGSETFSMGGDNSLQEYQWGFEGETDLGFPIRIYIWRGTVTAGEMQWGKKDYTVLPITIKSLADPTKPVGQNLFKFERVTAAQL